MNCEGHSSHSFLFCFSAASSPQVLSTNELQELSDEVFRLSTVHEIVLNADLEVHMVNFPPHRCVCMYIPINTHIQAWLLFIMSQKTCENMERRWVWPEYRNKKIVPGTKQRLDLFITSLFTKKFLNTMSIRCDSQ